MRVGLENETAPSSFRLFSHHFHHYFTLHWIVYPSLHFLFLFFHKLDRFQGCVDSASLSQCNTGSHNFSLVVSFRAGHWFPRCLLKWNSIGIKNDSWFGRLVEYHPLTLQELSVPILTTTWECQFASHLSRSPHLPLRLICFVRLTHFFYTLRVLISWVWIKTSRST